MSNGGEAAGLSLLQKYLTRDKETIVDITDMEASDALYKDIQGLCGDDIYDSLDGYLRSFLEDEDEDEDDLICFSLRDAKGMTTGFFMGYIEADGLESSYACAKPGGSRGELLRYMALLKARKGGADVSVLYGSPSGGIPAIRIGDSQSDISIKKKALVDYHVKRGATIEDGLFRYTIEQVLTNIRGFKGRFASSKKSKKNKKNKNKKTRKKKRKKDRKRKLTPQKYKELIHRRQTKTPMTKMQKKQLDNELFVNYCKCLKKLKYEKKGAKGYEYPYCATSIYRNRGFEVPKGVTQRCRDNA